MAKDQNVGDGARRHPRPRGRGAVHSRRCRHGRGEEVGREGVPALHADERAAAEGDGVLRQRGEALQGHGDQRPVGDDPDPRVRVEGADEGLPGDHRDQGESPGARGRRGRAGRPDADADQPEPLRRLHQRLGPDRHALAAAVGGQPHRLDGGRGQGRHAADAGRQRLHRQVVHHRPRRQALAAARPAVRESLLVPLRLVRAAGPEGEVQGQVRLRAGRAGRLVRLRGHRRVLLRGREDHRRRADLRSHGLRQARARPRLAHDGRVALDGRRELEGPAERPAHRRVGHPDGGGIVQPGRRVGVARRRDERPRGRLRRPEVGRVAQEVRAARRRRLRLLPVAAGAGPGQRGPAGLLVHGVHRVHGRAQERRQQHRRRQGQSALADGAVSARAVLGRGHEARLPGRRLVDAVQVDAARAAQGRVAVRAVHRVEDGGREEEPRRADLHPRLARSDTSRSPTARRSSAGSSSSIARPIA